MVVAHTHEHSEAEWIKETRNGCMTREHPASSNELNKGNSSRRERRHGNRGANLLIGRFGSISTKASSKNAFDAISSVAWEFFSHAACTSREIFPFVQNSHAVSLSSSAHLRWTPVVHLLPRASLTAVSILVGSAQETPRVSQRLGGHVTNFTE